MNTESVIASPATTSTAPSPSTLIATRGSCAHGRVCRWPLSRSMRTSSACTSLANSVASTVRDGPLGSPWYKVILMSPAPAAVRLFEDRDALDQVGPSQGPACLGGGARIDGTQPPQYVRRQLVVGKRRLGPAKSSLPDSMIAVDSVSTRSPCTIAVIVPCGLMAR